MSRRVADVDARLGRLPFLNLKIGCGSQSELWADVAIGNEDSIRGMYEKAFLGGSQGLLGSGSYSTVVEVIVTLPDGTRKTAALKTCHFSKYWDASPSRRDG